MPAPYSGVEVEQAQLVLMPRLNNSQATDTQPVDESRLVVGRGLRLNEASL